MSHVIGRNREARQSSNSEEISLVPGNAGAELGGTDSSFNIGGVKFEILFLAPAAGAFVRRNIRETHPARVKPELGKIERN